MQGNRKRDTRPEIALRRAVHALGLRYRVSWAPLTGVRRSGDLVFTADRVIVFVDGCFWHGCVKHMKPPRTNSEYWVPKLEGNVKRDRGTDTMLVEAGWLPIRVWEHEDPSTAAAQINDVIRSRRKDRLQRGKPGD